MPAASTTRASSTDEDPAAPDADAEGSTDGPSSSTSVAQSTDSGEGSGTSVEEPQVVVPEPRVLLGRVVANQGTPVLVVDDAGAAVPTAPALIPGRSTKLSAWWRIEDASFEPTEVMARLTFRDPGGRERIFENIQWVENSTGTTPTDPHFE